MKRWMRVIGVMLLVAAGLVASPDLNQDGVVDAVDRDAVVQYIGTTDVAGDANGDATVDIRDLVQVQQRMGDTFPAENANRFLVIDVSGGPTAASYPVTTLDALPNPIPDAYKTTKIVLRRIPAGTFTMGSPAGEVGHENDEAQHQVTLTEDFYMGVFEVTQKQYNLVMGTWPSWFRNASYRDMRPVEQVSYDDIRGSAAGGDWPANSDVDTSSFLGKLRTRAGVAFDLPTEAQWEYACRAGTTTALNSGVNLTRVYTDAAMDAVGRYAYNGGSGAGADDDLTKGPAAVGSYAANTWGLYDMHGNVWEWCLDWYGSYGEAVSDPQGASFSSYGRLLRGGSWDNFARECRSARRGSSRPDKLYWRFGFRLCLPFTQP